MRRREALVRTGLSGLALLLGEQAGEGQQAKPIGEIGMFKVHLDRVLSVAFSADGQKAVTCGQDETLKDKPLRDKDEPLPGTLRLWSVFNGNELCRLEGHKELVRSAVLSADGSLLLSGSYDDTMRLWDVTAQRPIRTFIGSNLEMKGTSHREDVNAVAFSPDERLAVSGGDDTLVKVWEVESGRQLRQLEGHADRIYCVAFTAGGGHIISGGADRTIRVWDRTTGSKVLELKGHLEGVSSVGIARDGRHILSASWDKTLRLWDLYTGKQVKQLEGHTEQIWAVALSPDGKWALSSSFDRTVRLWDVTAGKTVQEFKGHAKSLWAVAMSPDGKYGLSGGDEHEVRIWKLTDK